MRTPRAAKRLAGRAALLAAALVLAGVGRPASERPADEFLLERDVAVPMRDGVVLRADIWRPRGAGRCPVLVYRTPYDKQAAQEDYTIFRRAVERGVEYLLSTQRPDGSWDDRSWNGTGFPRVFFLKYHYYAKYFPLWALGVYRSTRA